MVLCKSCPNMPSLSTVGSTRYNRLIRTAFITLFINTKTKREALQNQNKNWNPYKRFMQSISLEYKYTQAFLVCQVFFREISLFVICIQIKLKKERF